MKVLVLGAGVIGVTSAWYLAKAGHEVTVLDRQPAAGMETSFANGGQISASHAQPWAKPAALLQIARWIGREDAPLLFRPRADWAQWRWGLGFLRECLPGRFERNRRRLAGLARYSLQSLRALREETQFDYDQHTRGILQIFTDEMALRPEECLRIEPALKNSEIPVPGGTHLPDDESGDAFKFTQNLAERARTLGVKFEFSTEIQALEAQGERIVSARTAQSRLEADAYVVALGSFSPLLLRPLGIHIPVYPMKGYSITLELDAAQQAVAPRVSITDEEHKIVITRLGDRLRAAGTAELAGYDASADPGRCEAIRSRVVKLFPALKSAPRVEFWAGLRPATPSNIPLIGRTRLENLFLNTGHGTLGWTLACGSARALGDIVAGRRPDVDFGFL